jgi:hypothetical protein
MGNFNSPNLSNTAWSFTTMNHEAPVLFDAIARAAPTRIGDFNSQTFSNTAWSFATMNHDEPLLFDAIARAAQGRIDDFCAQGLANMAWSFAVFNIGPDSFIPAESPFARALLSRDPSSFSVEGLRQLHQFICGAKNRMEHAGCHKSCSFGVWRHLCRQRRFQ